MNNRKNWPTIIREGKATMVFNAGHDLLHYLDGTYPPNYLVPVVQDKLVQYLTDWHEWVVVIIRNTHHDQARR